MCWNPPAQLNQTQNTKTSPSVTDGGALPNTTMKTKIASLMLALLTITAPAQNSNVQTSSRVTVTTNLSTAQGPKQVNNAGTAGADDSDYSASVANRHVLLLTGADSGSGAARAADQHGRLTSVNAIPVPADFLILSPGLWIRTNDGVTFIPSEVSISYDFFRFSNGSWLKWTAPSFTATLNIANEARVVRDAAGNPLADQSHTVPVRAVSYIPVYWFGESTRSTLESQRVCLRETVTIPSTKDGVTVTETFVRFFSPFDGGPNLETGTWVGATAAGENWQLTSNLLPPVTGNSSGPWQWQSATNLANWTPLAGTGNPFSFVTPTTAEQRMQFRLATTVVGGARNAPAPEPVFKGGHAE